MEEEGFLNHGEGFILIGYIPPLPPLQTHDKIGMVSVPSMTQEQYEASVLRLGYVTLLSSSALYSPALRCELEHALPPNT